MNYCRQILKEIRTAIAENKGRKPTEKTLEAVAMIQGAQKFLLPHNGELVADEQLRALDEFEALRIPFDIIALEYSRDVQGGLRAKFVVFVRDMDDVLEVVVATHSRESGGWRRAPIATIPKVGAIRREKGFAEFRSTTTGDDEDGAVQDALVCFMGFLNALQCSNVVIDKLPAQHRPGKQPKNALPFDSYHVLTLKPAKGAADGLHNFDHRSPREHLRRGHIRRYASGLKVWVNATVVNPGIGARVDKDYRVAA